MLHTCSVAAPLRPGSQPVLQVGDAALHLAHVEVSVAGEVLADGRVGVAQGAVEGGPPDAYHHGHEAKQEKEQARVSSSDLWRTSKKKKKGEEKKNKKKKKNHSRSAT